MIDPSDTEGLRRTVTDAIRRGALATPPQDRALLRAFERPALTRLLASVFETVTHQSAVA